MAERKVVFTEDCIRTTDIVPNGRSLTPEDVIQFVKDFKKKKKLWSEMEKDK
jgi:hypothetical protein